MKKIYAFIIAMVASVAFPAAMHAIQIHLEVDDPSNVTVQVNYEPITLQAGDNALDIELYSPISIAATEDAFLISVVRKSTGVSEYVYNMSIKYVTKLIPLPNRIVMPKVYDMGNSNLLIYDNRNNRNNQSY